MGSNQNPWTPYKDCSLGICTIYCPQFCYFIFPPPLPDDDDSTTGFSPLIIAIIGVLAGAFILVSYYTIATRCRRRNPTTSAGAAELHREAANGLEEAVIKTITVCKYREGEGLIEGSECAVCLSEFQENEALRLLPKCSHAFHLPCIDTWLKSHSNCPLCRAGVMGSPHPIPPPQAPTLDSNFEFERPRDDELVIMVDNRDADDGEDAMPRSPNREDEEGISHLRRSASLGTLPSQRRRLVSDNAMIDGVKGRSWREIGSSNTSGTVELVSSNCKGKNTMLLPD